MLAPLIVKSIAVGFVIAVPTGPVGALCVRRSLAEGRRAGLLSGLGSALGDAFYVTVAEFGISTVSSFIASQRQWLHLAGCILVVCLGVSIIAKAKLSAISAGKRGERSRTFVPALLLSLLNPTILLSLTALLASLGLAADKGDYASAAIVVAAVFTGSALWWLMVTSILDRMRGKLTEIHLTGLNRLTGVIITGSGLSALLVLTVAR